MTAAEPPPTGYDALAPVLLVERRGSVRVVTLNRPDTLNAANLALHEALAEVWRLLERDDDARAVVLTGAGSAFSAGGDLHHIQAMHTDVELRRQDLQTAAALVRDMCAFPLPVIAAVNGPAVGLGATLAVLCDIVLIADSAYLADPHVTMGLTAADGGASLWPLHMSLHKAKEYLFTGDRIPADVAVELGLANRVVPQSSVLAEALALAERLAGQPRHALASTKKSLHLHLRQALTEVLDAALAEEFASFDDAEHQQRVRDWLARENRPDKA